MTSGAARAVRLGLSVLLALGCESSTAPLDGDVDRDLAPFPWMTSTWADVGRSCDSTARAEPVSALVLTALGLDEPVPYSTINEQYAALARRVPGGFGGWFIRDGIATIVLVDPSKRVEALAALRAAGQTAIPTTAAVERGRWTFAELYDWNRVLEERFPVLGIPMGRDIDEAANRLDYMVQSEEDRALLEALLTRLRVPCRLVAIEVGPFPVPR